jgi:hypothetical protein
MGVESSVMMAASDIRDQIGLFLEAEKGMEKFDGFEDWLIRHSWNIHKSGTIEAQALVYAVELLIAEYHAGEFSFPQLRLELQQVANTYVPPNQNITTGSSTLSTPTLWPIRAADKRPVTASE